MKKLGQALKNPGRSVRVKQMIMGKGEFFGEEECLKLIVNNGDEYGTKPSESYYTVTCESTDAEIMWANIEDVYKLLKNERKVVKFMNNEYIKKYPTNRLPDKYLEEVFRAKNLEKSRESSPDDSKADQEATVQPAALQKTIEFSPSDPIEKVTPSELSTTILHSNYSNVDSSQKTTAHTQ